jgi:hypothetical protein
MVCLIRLGARVHYQAKDLHLWVFFFGSNHGCGVGIPGSGYRKH